MITDYPSAGQSAPDPRLAGRGDYPSGILDGDVRIFIKAYIRGIPRGLNKAVEAPQSFLLTFNNSKVDLL